MKKEFVMVEKNQYGLLEVLVRCWAIKNGVRSVSWTYGARMTSDSRVYLHNSSKFWEDIPRLIQQAIEDEMIHGTVAEVMKRIQPLTRTQIAETFIHWLEQDRFSNVSIEDNEVYEDSPEWMFRSLKGEGEYITNLVGIPYQKTTFWVSPWTAEAEEERPEGVVYKISKPISIKA